jgi:5-methylthioadenosine/S-adenosylhomocysteine deaminase
MFLADGVTRIPDLIKAGVKISLGTDGGCSNNRISVFEEMRMCALLQKVTHLDGTCITADEVYRMGTTNAGDVLRLPIGSLEAGKYADFVAIDLDDLSLAPKKELFANMVYAMQPGAITHVVVNGRTVFDKSGIQTVSEREISRLVEQLLDKWPQRS